LFHVKEGKSIEPEDIEDILLDVMCGEFCTVLEDGSEVEVAKSIWTLYQECVKGNTALLESLRQRAGKILNLNVVKPPNEESSSEEYSEDDNVPMDE
jgi:hypothetical protein